MRIYTSILLDVLVSSANSQELFQETAVCSRLSEASKHFNLFFHWAPHLIPLPGVSAKPIGLYHGMKDAVVLPVYLQEMEAVL